MDCYGFTRVIDVELMDALAALIDSKRSEEREFEESHRSASIRKRGMLFLVLSTLANFSARKTTHSALLFVKEKSNEGEMEVGCGVERKVDLLARLCDIITSQRMSFHFQCVLLSMRVFCYAKKRLLILAKHGVELSR